MGKAVKVWLKEPRYAWRNDGGEIPRRFRGRCRRRDGKKTIVINDPTCPQTKVRLGHWIVEAGGSLYGFDRSSMERLYSSVPL